MSLLVCLSGMTCSIAGSISLVVHYICSDCSKIRLPKSGDVRLTLAGQLPGCQTWVEWHLVRMASDVTLAVVGFVKVLTYTDGQNL